jgi:LysR substrate binding domain.
MHDRLFLLAVQKNATFKQISDLDFILMKSDFLHHGLLMQLFKKHHEKLNVISRTGQIQTYKSLIASDAGIGLITEMAIDPRSDTSVPLTLAEPGMPDFNVFLCYLKDRFLTELEQKVIELLST